MSMTTVIVNFLAKPGQRDALVGALSQAIQYTITKPDCYECDLSLDQDDDTRFYMTQQWSSSDAHKAYLEEIMQKPEMGKLMEMMAAPPDTRYATVTAAGGGLWGGPGHLELSSNDVDGTKKLLGDVFGWTFADLMPGYTGWWAPGALMGGIMPTHDDMPNPQAVPYLVVDDLDARFEAVKAAGGEITVPIQEVPNAGRFFWFIAPGGLQLAVWESAAK